MTHLLADPQTNLRDAIHIASHYAPCGICYVDASGWAPYDLTTGCDIHQADYVFYKRGHLPIPLHELAAECLFGAITSQVRP